MKNLASFAISALLIFQSLAYGQPAFVKLRDVIEVEFAQRVVIIELARALSPSSRLSRERCGQACSESGALELGVSLLGVGGDTTTVGLLSLLALRLDGAGGEEMHCQILKRGKRVIPVLKKLNTTHVASWCQTKFDAVRKRELSDVFDVAVDQVCRPAQEIDSDRISLVSSLRAGERCGD